MRRFPLHIVSLTTSLVLALAACGGSSSSPSAPQNNTGGPTTGGNTGGSVNTNQVTVGVGAFTPTSITVAAGTTVTWTWNSCSTDPYYGQTCVSHSVMFDQNGGPQSLTQDSGSWSYTFTTKGTFTYHCAVHGTSMSGTVVVQ